MWCIYWGLPADNWQMRVTRSPEPSVAPERPAAEHASLTGAAVGYDLTSGSHPVDDPRLGGLGTHREHAVSLFCVPSCCAVLASCACCGIATLTQRPMDNKQFPSGDVAEGGGLLNRYTLDRLSKPAGPSPGSEFYDRTLGYARLVCSRWLDKSSSVRNQ